MAEFIATGRTVPAENGWKWIVQGWNLFKRAPGVWIALMVVFIVISIVLAFVPVLGSIASMVLTPTFTAGMMIGCRARDEGGELKVEHLFAGEHLRNGGEFHAVFSHDPRGATVKIQLPSGIHNTIGQDGFAVPTSGRA